MLDPACYDRFSSHFGIWSNNGNIHISKAVMAVRSLKSSCRHHKDSGFSPFSRKIRLCPNPTNCCSSMIIKPSRAYSTPSCIRAWVPTITSTSPLAIVSKTYVFLQLLVNPLGELFSNPERDSLGTFKNVALQGSLSLPLGCLDNQPITAAYIARSCTFYHTNIS